MQVGRLTLFSIALATSAVAAVLTAGVTLSGGTATARCDGSPDGRPQTNPAPGDGCWAEVTPYPFGSDGNAVDLQSVRCRPAGGEPVASCYLTATSLAFRAWNRGLAATSTEGEKTSAFGVWLFNGKRWFPDPTFPGQRVCKGNTILWAGKLDYWLVGPGNGEWPSLCRFDGSSFLWQPIPVPAATTKRVTEPGATAPRSGGITAGACYAWNDCWFFGTHGTVVRWNGRVLTDASPRPGLAWLGNGYTAAVTRRDSDGRDIGLAVTATSDDGLSDGPTQPRPGGLAPPQLFSSGGAEWSPSEYTPPTVAAPGDPFRTDLIAVDFDPATGHGWTVGVPASHRTGLNRYEYLLGRGADRDPVPSPVAPLTALTPGRDCIGPEAETFLYARQARQINTYLWSSVAAVPGAGDAIAGGQMRLAGTGTGNAFGVEPVLAHVRCDGTFDQVRFRIPDPTAAAGAPFVPANRSGTITAVASTAPNDAWAATTSGQLARAGTILGQQPRLYRFGDTLPTQALDGDDKEQRPLQLEVDPPVIVFEPLPPPEPPPVAPVTTTTQTVRLKPAVYAVTTRVKNLNLYVSMRVRRPIVLGVNALRQGSVVATTGYRTLRPPRAQLRLKLDPKRWPTEIKFINDLPSGVLIRPPARLTGSVTLRTRGVAAVRGRSVASVRFELTPTRKDEWTTIDTVRRRPFVTTVDTLKFVNTSYDFRIVITDSAGKIRVAPTVVGRRISNPVAPILTARDRTAR